MKNLLTLCFSLVIISTIVGQNQNWNPIRTDDTYFYFDNHEYRAYYVDTVITEELKKEYITNSEVFSTEFYECVNPFGPNWLGKRIKVYNDSTIFTNLKDFEIIIHHTPTFNTKWILFKKRDKIIYAQLKSKGIEDIGYGRDSIMTIELSSNDYAELNDIKISKHHGLINTPDFLLFPDITTEFTGYTEFKLTGQVSQTTSDANLTIKQVYDFDIGDEIHTHKLHESYDGFNVITDIDQKIIKTVSQKEFINDSSQVIYTYEICDKHGKRLVTDTINLNSKALDNIPYHPIIEENDGHKELFTYTQYINDKMVKTKRIHSGWQHESDSCYQFVFYDKKSKSLNNFMSPLSGHMHYEGLGGNYYSYGFMFSQGKYDVTYYKKGNMEWGKPFNCDSLQVSVNENSNHNLKLYPNPVSTEFFIDGISEPATISIFTIDGSLLMQACLKHTIEHINAIELTPGTYAYVIEYEQGKVIKKGRFIKK